MIEKLSSKIYFLIQLGFTSANEIIIKNEAKFQKKKVVKQVEEL